MSFPALYSLRNKLVVEHVSHEHNLLTVVPKIIGKRLKLVEYTLNQRIFLMKKINNAQRTYFFSNLSFSTVYPLRNTSKFTE